MAEEFDKITREEPVGISPRMMRIVTASAVLAALVVLLLWNAGKTGVYLRDIVSIIMTVVLILLLADIVRISRHNAGLTPAVKFDEARFDLFNNALDSLCIAAGIEKRRLAVMKLRSANSYVINSGETGMIAVTPDLLELELTAQQVEAVMAVAVAKVVLQPLPAKPESLKEKDIVPPQASTPLEIRADTLAARITGQPEALREAILKVAAMVARAPAWPYRVPSSDMFVAPPAIGYRASRRTETGMDILKSRLENLEKMERGTWQPFERVRDSKPVTLPKGWH
jgi:Zn-dependent protease with chaperone function